LIVLFDQVKAAQRGLKKLPITMWQLSERRGG
jgi:hypothetical protein